MYTVYNFIYIFFLAFCLYRILYSLFFNSFYKVDSDESKESMNMQLSDGQLEMDGKNKLIYLTSNFRMIFFDFGSFVASLIGLFSGEYKMFFTLYFLINIFMVFIVIFKRQVYVKRKRAFDLSYYFITTLIAMAFSFKYVLYIIAG